MSEFRDAAKEEEERNANLSNQIEESLSEVDAVFNKFRKTAVAPEVEEAETTVNEVLEDSIKEEELPQATDTVVTPIEVTEEIVEDKIEEPIDRAEP